MIDSSRTALPFRAAASREEITRKNREIYDGASSDPVWRLIIYEGLHGGWEFINLGGRELLEAIGRRHALGPRDAVLELCSGQGDTCRYLAERYGCHVTGVEMNPRQVSRARERLAGLDAALARRLHFVEADVLSWDPPQRYDAVCSIDALMLIPDLPELFARAWAALLPGRRLSVATLCAGPAADDRIRRFAWEADGMISLSTPEEIRDLLGRAGFVDVEAEDLTALAIRSSEEIAAALIERRDRVVRIQGEEAFQGWWQVGEIYLAGFRDRRLLYSLFSARRP